MQYTANAKKVLELAKKIAKQLNYNYIGTEHILAALLKEGKGVAAEILLSNGVEYAKLLSMIEDLIAPGNDTLVMDKKGYSPRTEEVLRGAEAEATRFQSDEIGTEHLLIAILKEVDCAASRLLNTLGCNASKMFVEILGAMGENPAKYKDEIQKSRSGSIGGITPTLDQYSRDLTMMARDGQLDPVIGRSQETNRMMQVLCRRGKNNHV